MTDRPRNATCQAFGQPRKSGAPEERSRLVFRHKQYQPTEIAWGLPEGADDAKAVARVELVRIPREVFTHLVETFPALRRRIAEVVRQREQHNHQLRERRPATPARGLTSGEAARLGLVQGQQLMLIDLERCTRCDECVKACVDAHDDGHTRLFLFGPRFDKYLVPTTCRSCMDPVCMIGCPVRAIQRGDNGEMEITDWCIGCTKCAKQCPYDSIQMHELAAAAKAESEAPANTVEVKTRAVVCDLCSSTALGTPACVYACPHDAAVRVNAPREL
jgi:Fe-S-cluster-containing hydrogenase component 2